MGFLEATLGLIPGLGQAYGSYKDSQNVKNTNEMNYRIAQENNRANAQLAERQNDWNIAQWAREQDMALKNWNRQNAYNENQLAIERQYNSPAAQMQRYADAGLNPHLIYGQQNVSGGLTASPLQVTSGPRSVGYRNEAPRMEAYTRTADSIRSMTDGLLRTLSTVGALKMQDAQIAEARNRATNVDLQNALLRSKLPFADQMAEYAKNLAFWNMENAEATHEQQAYRKWILKQTAEHNSTMFPMLERYQNMSNQKMRYYLDYIQPKEMRRMQLGNEMLVYQIANENIRKDLLGEQYVGQQLKNEFQRWYNNYHPSEVVDYESLGGATWLKTFFKLLQGVSFSHKF